MTTTPTNYKTMQGITPIVSKLKTIIKYNFVLIALLLLSNIGWGQYSGTGTFTQISSLASLSDGYYVIAYGTTQAMSNTLNSGNYFQNTSITPTSGVISNPPTSIVWKITTVSGNIKTIYNEAGSIYVSYSGSSNALYSSLTFSGNPEKFTFAYGTSLFTLQSVNVSGRYIQYNPSSPRFACYAGSQQDITLYQMSSATNYYWGGATNNTTGNWDNSASKWNNAASGSGSLVWPSSGSYNANFNTTGGNAVINQNPIVVAPTNVTIGANVTFSTAGTQAGSLTSPIALGTSTILTTAPVSGANLTLSGAISGSGTINQNAAGTTVLSGTNSYSLGTTITSGTLSTAADNNTGTGNFIMAGGTLGVTTGYSTAKTFTFNSNSTIDVTSGQTLTTTGTFSGTGTLNKANSGILNINVSNSSTFAGGKYNITGGTLVTGTSGFFGSPSSIVNNFFTINGGTLDFTGFSSASVNQGIVLGNNSSNGIAMTSGTITMPQVISDLSTSGILNKTGAGTISISGANTYTGATNINGGTLQCGLANTLPSSTDVTVATGATMDLNSKSQTIGSLAGAGNVSLGTSATLTVGNANNTTLSGNITQTATSTLVKQGAGIFTLSGSGNSITTTTISAGTLNVTGTLTSTITAGASGTLTGTGTVGATTVNGTISPATVGTIGTLTTGNLTLGAGGTYTVDINNVTGASGTICDKIAAGTLTNSATSGSKFTISVNGTITGFSAATTTSWTIGTYTGSAPSTTNIQFAASGTLSGYANNLSIAFTSGNIILTYTKPSIAGTATASAFTTTYGTASAAQSFSISGSNLSANITATAPTGFEVSSDGTTYGATATFTQSSGAASGTLNIRLAATAAVTGTYNSQTIALTSTNATQVNITTASTGNTVTAKGLTITGLTGANKTYDGLTSASFTGTPAYSGLQNGETFSVTGTPSASFATVAVGTGKTINVSGYTAPSSNYTLTQPSLTGDITAKALTITGLTGINKVYDGTTTATASGTAAYSGLVNGETFSVTGSPSASFANATVGTGKTITVSGYTAPSGNYSITQPSLIGDITAKSLTVTADNQSVCYGTSATTVTGNGSTTITGFVNNETSSVITGTVSYSTTYTSTTAAGTSSITITPDVTLLTASNYSFNAATGTITVTAIPSAPTATTPQILCPSATVNSLAATGTAIQWYDAASGGNLLSSATALTHNSHYYATQTVNGCASSTRTDVTASLQNAWLGSSSSSWNNASNWSCGHVPTATENVLINTGSPALDINYEVPASYTLTLSGTGTLTINPGNKLTITGTTDFGNKLVTVAANASNTGAIVLNGGSLQNATNVALQQWFTGQRAWRMLSNPFTTSITGSNIASDNTSFSVNQSGTGDIVVYNSANDSWSANTTIAANSCYAFFYKGLQSDFSGTPGLSNYNVGQGPTATVYSVKGTLNTGSVTVTPSNASPAYTLVGNPFAAPVNSIALTGGATAPYYCYQANLASTDIKVKSGAWIVANSNSSNTTTIPMMGLIAYQASSTTSFTIPIADINTSGSAISALFKTTAAATQMNIDLMKNNILFDRCILREDADATAQRLDQKDLLKMENVTANIYTLTPANDHLAVYTEPSFTQAIPLAISAPVGTYQFNIQNAMNSSADWYLIDNYLHQQKLLTNNSTYSFDINNDAASKGSQRFELSKQTWTTSIGTTSNQESIQLLGNLVQDHITLQVDATIHLANYQLVDLRGAVLAQGTLSAGKQEIAMASLASGLYILHIQNDHQRLAYKITKQ